MTALCPGGGPSQPLPGTDASIGLNGAIVAAFATALGAPELAPVIAVATGGTVLAVDLFCASDPPADPNLTPTDWQNAQSPSTPGDYFTALGRIKDWFLHQYWWNLCQCTGATTPPAPSPNLPTGIGVGTGLPTGANAPPCWDTTASFALDAYPTGGTGAGGTWWKDVHTPMLPSGTEFTFVGGGPGSSNTTMYQIPNGANHVTVKVTCNAVASGGFVLASVATLNSAGSSSTGNTVAQVNAGGTTATTTTATLSSSAYWWGCVVENQSSVSQAVTVEVSFSCTTGVGLNTPCCPPDPTVDQYLSQILSVVNQILLTQPTPLTSYADSTAHAGLVNAGSFVLGTGTIGVRAHFQSLPPSFGGNMGSPPLAYRAGRVTAAANTEPLRDFLIQFDQQVFALPTLTTEIYYTLPVGVVLTLTELTRGP